MRLHGGLSKMPCSTFGGTRVRTAKRTIDFLIICPHLRLSLYCILRDSDDSEQLHHPYDWIRMILSNTMHQKDCEDILVCQNFFLTIKGWWKTSGALFGPQDVVYIVHFC